MESADSIRGVGLSWILYIIDRRQSRRIRRCWPASLEMASDAAITTSDDEGPHQSASLYLFSSSGL